MSTRIVAVPYDSGLRGARLGAGPERLLGAGLARRVEAEGGAVDVVTIEAIDAWRAEIRTSFELMRGAAAAVRAARVEGRFPLVLSGNCSVTVGALAGVESSAPGTGLIWFDAHGDFNTPETTLGGLLDGMALAMATGRCWPELVRSVRGFVPLTESAVCLAGARDLDPLEAVALDASGVRRVSCDDLEADPAAALSALGDQVRQVYLHIDLDVLDPSGGRVNQYASPAGLRVDVLERVIAAIGAKVPILGATMSAYDPAFDVDGRVNAAALRVAAAVVRAVR